MLNVVAIVELVWVKLERMPSELCLIESVLASPPTTFELLPSVLAVPPTELLLDVELKLKRLEVLSVVVKLTILFWSSVLVDVKVELFIEDAMLDLLVLKALTELLLELHEVDPDLVWANVMTEFVPVIMMELVEEVDWVDVMLKLVVTLMEAVSVVLQLVVLLLKFRVFVNDSIVVECVNVMLESVPLVTMKLLLVELSVLLALMELTVIVVVSGLVEVDGLLIVTEIIVEMAVLLLEVHALELVEMVELADVLLWVHVAVVDIEEVVWVNALVIEWLVCVEVMLKLVVILTEVVSVVLQLVVLPLGLHVIVDDAVVNVCVDVMLRLVALLLVELLTLELAVLLALVELTVTVIVS
jgi:hypothetical protein